MSMPQAFRQRMPSPGVFSDTAASTVAPAAVSRDERAPRILTPGGVRLVPPRPSEGLPPHALTISQLPLPDSLVRKH
jgi:hypothetical protein